MVEQGTKQAKTTHQVSTLHKQRVRFTRWFFRLLGNPLIVNGVCKTTITGMENIPQSGPAIAVFNHTILVDPAIIMLSIKSRDVLPITKYELSDSPATAWLMWGWDTIPIRRGEVDMTALKRSIEALRTNEILLISPEGHRQPEGMHDPKEGISMLAIKTGAPIIPIGVSGAEKFWDNLKHFRRTAIHMNIGKPFCLKTDISRKQYRQAADEIMYKIAALVSPNIRGVYSDLSKATIDTIAGS